MSVREEKRRHRQYPRGLDAPPSKSMKRLIMAKMERPLVRDVIATKPRKRDRSVTARLRGTIPEFRNRLANARDNRPRHIQRKHLASGWTLTKALRMKLRNRRRAALAQTEKPA